MFCAAVAAALTFANPGTSQAQSPDAPAAKSAPKRAKSGTAGDAQQSPAAASVKRDPAAAQATIEAAGKLLEAGKTDQAVSSLSGAIAGGNLPPAVMARALYLRGAAHRKQAKPAQAISDLTSALWLKGGLSDTDRADATQQRTAAYSEAGLGDQGQTSSAAAQGAGSRTRVDGSVASLAPDSGAAPATASSSSFFGKLFGSSTTAAASSAPAVAVTPTPETPPKPARPQRAALEPAPASNAQPASQLQPARIAAATVAASAYQSRVALVKTRAEADAVVAKLKAQHSAALADKTAAVGETAFGGMGTFFQVRIGPFSTAAEATALCGKLKGSGLDCVAVNN
jgi:SPOR domain